MTGAIFARGSCRALKWMALFGVVFALGAGQAAAQVKVSGSPTTGLKGDEGGRVTVTVTADIRVGANQATAQTWTVAAPEANVTGITADHVKMLSPADGSGGSDDYTLPTGNEMVRVPPNSSGTPADHTLEAKFTIQLQSDADAEDEVFNIVFAESIATNLANLDNVTQRGKSTAIATPNAAARTRKVTINDTDNQDFMWKVTTTKPKEGANIMATLTAEPTPVDLEYDVAISVDTTGYTIMPTTHQFDAEEADGGESDGPSVTLTITVPMTDKDRIDNTITVNATTAGTVDSLVTPLPIKVEDLHALPMTDKISVKAYTDDNGKMSKTEAMSVTEGGDPVHVKVEVDRGTTGYPKGENLKVQVMAANSGQALDYRIDPGSFEIDSGPGKKSKVFKLWALKDDDIGAEDLMLNLKVTGAKTSNGPGEVMPMPMFKIAIKDDTAPKVWVKDGAKDAIYKARMAAAGDDMKINPGESFEIMTDDLFAHLPTVTVAYAAASDNGAVLASASGDKIMIMPQEMEGKAKVTLTATATDKASSFKMEQTKSDIAKIMFEVDVMLGAFTYTLMGPEDMNIPEGMSAKVTAMASRKVDADTMVELIQTGGTASPADYTVEPITIKAGEMEGYTMVMAVEDMTMEEGMETLTLEGRVGSMKTNTVMLHFWDASVPALPIIAQLLLAFFLAIGGYRRYLRR